MLTYYHFGKWSSIMLKMMMMMMVMTSLLLVPFSGGRCYADAVAIDKVTIEHDVLRFSYELESWLDLTKKPCDDFYGYVCASSLNATPQARLEKLSQQEDVKFNKFLENSNNEVLMDAELKLKYFYESCRNARSIDQLKATLMYRSVGGWPAIDDAPAMLRKRNNITWLQVLSIFQEAGKPYFFNTKIELSSNKRVVHLSPDNSLRFNLPKFEQLAGKVMHSYQVDVGRARLVALEILSFERNSKDIRNLNITDEVQEYSYADFKQLSFGSVKPLDWDAYFRKVMGKPLKATDLVIVSDMLKLQQYFELLQATSLTRFLNWLWIDYLMDKSSTDCKKLTKTYFAPVYQHIVQCSAVDKIQMAQMYSELGQLYDQILANTPWIDEMTQQNSKQFLGRIMHLTLNGDAKLDAIYQPLTITNRNFYRNLEKTQRFKARQLLMDNGNGDRNKQQANNAMHLAQSTNEFMAIFPNINQLIQQQQNLSIPLNYLLVGEHFSEVMIAGAYDTPGAWRSMDSERQFELFDKCLLRQQPQLVRNFNLNKLVLKILSQQLSWQTYKMWLQRDEEFIQKLDTLLKAGRLQMSMEKLYFISSTLVDCQLNHQHQPEQKQFIHTHLKQSKEFQQIFKCQPRDSLYTANKCLIIKEN